MIVDNKLEIFENFISIPKKQSSQNSSITIGSISGSISGFSVDNMTAAMQRDASNDFLSESYTTRAVDYLHYVHMHEHSISSWVKYNVAKILFPNKKVTKIRYQSVDEFFNEVKDAVKTLEISEGSINFYINAIESAKENGQIALLEILKEKKEGILKEVKLLDSLNEQIQYVSEEDVVKFYKKANLKNKMLKLTWIKNYARLIPSDVLEKKKVFDVIDIFDNYVILHFDKNGDSTEMTQAEKEKAKDPILFGVLKGTRKLYYIGDWIDEYCDLTLDKFLSTLEMEESRKLTEETVQSQI
jgi:hypothetical protein